MLTSTQLTNFAKAANLTQQSPVMLVDTDILRDSCKLFKELFPQIDLYYALKCFTDERIVATADEYLDGYDVASIPEIEMLLNSGVSAERISFSNPVKPAESIKKASQLGVNRFAFQSVAELDKIAEHASGSSVYLRVDVSSAKGSLDFSSKFGADYNEALPLLTEAVNHGLTPLGVTFHVGSQAQDMTAWSAAIERAAGIMRQAKDANIVLGELNIGGGFPVQYRSGDLSIVELAEVINKALSQLSAEFPGTRFIAEPGRFLTAECAAILTTVIGRETRGDKPWLYLDTGTFQSFIEVFEFNDFMYPVYSLNHLAGEAQETETYALTGPTCDSYDTMTRGIELPKGIAVGDRLLISMTGAYTLAYGSNFNGFAVPNIVFIESADTSANTVVETESLQEVM